MPVEIIEGSLSLCPHTIGISLGGQMEAFWCAQCGAFCTRVERYAEAMVESLKAAGVTVTMKAGYVQQASTGKMVQLYAISPAPPGKKEDKKMCPYCGGAGYITKHGGDHADRCQKCGGSGKVKAS